MITSKLDTKLKLLKVNISRGELGEPLEFFEPIQTLYGSILNERGNKSYSSLPGIAYTTTISVWLRYNPNISKKSMRVEMNGETFSILEAKHISPRQATIITLQAVQ